MRRAARKSYEIVNDILNEIDLRGGKAKRFDLLRVVGSEEMFGRYLDRLLLEHGLVRRKGSWYVKTDEGNLLHEVVKKGRTLVLISAAISGKKLRRDFLWELVP